MAARAPERRLRKDAEQNRARLLAAAAQVFHEQGVGACLDDVARRAEVGVGTLYRRFPSREALLEAMLADLLAVWSTQADDALAMPDGQGLAAFLRAVGAVQASPQGCALRLWTSPAVEAARLHVRVQMRSLITDAQAHGTCRPEVSVDDLLGIFVALRGVRELPTGDVALDWHRHLELCLAGLRP